MFQTVEVIISGTSFVHMLYMMGTVNLSAVDFLSTGGPAGNNLDV